METGLGTCECVHATHTLPLAACVALQLHCAHAAGRYLVTWKHPAACGVAVTWRWQYARSPPLPPVRGCNILCMYTVNIVAIGVVFYFVGMFA